MHSSRLLAGLLATLVALSACTDPNPPDTGAAPTLSEATLPETTLDVKYTATLGASGGKTPYAFSAQGLPPGLLLASDSGALSGSASAAGDFQVQVTVKDASGKQASKSYPLKVYPGVSFKQTTLPQATAEAPYSATLEAEGGKAPLTLRMSAGDLPPGISFNAARGQLSGTPPSFGTFALAIEAIDVHGAKATQTYSVVVAGPLRLFTSSLPAGNVGRAYSQTLSTSGGRAPFTFSLESGALPAGVSLSHDALVGTPLAAGRSSFVLKVTDANGATATGSLTLDVHSNLPPQLATATLAEGLLGRDYTQVLTGEHGAPPYTFALASGTLPAGLQLSAGGVLSGTPTTPGTASFQVALTDSNGQVARRNFTLRVSSLLSVQTASLAEAYKDQLFTQALSASGGTPPYRWEAQGALPEGLTLSTAGLLSGTPKAASAYGLTLSVSDSAGQSVSAALTLSVLTLPGLTLATLADGAVGVAYNQRLQASGGKAPYTFALSGGALPPGLSLSGDTLSGTPAAAVTSSLTLQVTDANGKSSQRDYALRVFDGLTITTGSLTAAYVGRAYSHTLSAVAGTAPYTWAPVGPLPAGLTLSAAGVLSGTPTTAGTPSLTVKVTDGANATVSRALELRVLTPPSVATASLPEASQGVAYSATLSGADGLGPYQWRLSAGALPTGLTLSSEGVLSGTPTGTGTASFTVELTDANAVKATRALSLTVTTFNVTTASLGDGYMGQAYSAALTASGGVTPLTWQLTGLPVGLTYSASTGAVSGQPSALGTATVNVRVTDAQNRVATRDLSLAVYALPQVTTTTLPEGSVNVAYTQALAASQGKAPYTWSVTAGTLPPGLAVSATPAPWAVSGTPTESGTRTFTVQVADANGKTASRDLSLTVVSALAITTASLPAAYNNVAYDQTLNATGGKSPYTFDRSAGNLPGGLSLSPTGRLSGTVATNATTATFTARVTDANGAQATRAFTITVTTGPQVTTALLTPATEGVAYRRSEASPEKLEATNGQAPYTWAATGLPSGLSLNASTGELLGTPAQGSEGSYSITFSVTDAGGLSGGKALTLEVGKPRATATGGVVGLAPAGSRITDTLTVFAYSNRRPQANVGVRVRKNGVEYSPIKQALTNAEGKVVFTGLGLNGTSDTVDITANGKELVNTTLAKVNASVVTVSMLALPVLGRQLSSNVYDPSTGRFLVYGGNRGGPTNLLFSSVCASDTVEAVDVAQRDFRTLVQGGLTSAPSARYDAPMAMAGGTAVLFGGRACETLGDALGDTWEFTLATNTWQQVSPASGAPSPRTGAALVRGPTGNLVYLVGGYRFSQLFSNELWRYDAATNTWAFIGTAPFSRYAMASTLHTGTGELWFCGGRDYSASTACHSYHPATNVWTSRPALPSARYDFAMAYDPNTENLYAFGGRRSASVYYGDLLVLRKNATAWESIIPTGDAPPARSGHALYFDLTRKELVLTLGYTRDPATAVVSRPTDLWTYNGTAWTQRGTTLPLPGHTLSGTVTGGAPDSQVTLRVGTSTGALSSATVTLNGQGTGTYTLSGIPAGEALFLSALNTDPLLPYPNDLWSFVGVELAPLVGNTTQHLTLPAGPLVRLESSGQFILPASWRGTLYYAYGYAELEVPGFPKVANGTRDASLDFTTQFATSYPQSGMTQRQRLQAYLSSTQGCEDHGLYPPLTPNAGLQVAVTGSVSGLNPGVAECTPSGSTSGLGLARDSFSYGNQALDQPVVEDLDKDSFPDVVYASTTGWDAYISWGGPDHSIGNVTSVTNPEADCCESFEPQAVAVGDFNKDGRPDLAYPRPVTGHALVKLAHPTTPRIFLTATSFQVGTKPTGIATADVNGDGNLDLLVASQDTGTVAFLAGNGNGTFQAAQTVTLAGTSPRKVLATHLDGDTKPDLVVVMAEGISVSLDGTTNGPFGASTLIAAGSQPSAVVVGLLNAGTVPDMAVANEGSNTVTLHLGAGGGTFAAPTQLAAGTAPAGLVLAELTGDTHLDLAVSSSGDGVVTLLQGASNGTFTPHSKAQVPGMPRGLAAVDHNGDGAQDLIVTSPGADIVSILPGQKAKPTSAGNSFTFTAPSNSRFVWSMHGVNGGPRYWDYYAPVQAGAVTYALPLASTLAPSAAPVTPTTGKVMRTWNPWVMKWEPSSSTPFNPNQYFLNMLGQDTETQPGAHHYQWP
jgi:hypothetical protein